MPDVAGAGCAQPGRPQDRREHLHRRRLAVRSRHGEPRGRARAGTHPPGELDLAPDGYAVGRRLGEQRVVGPPSRGRDDEVDRLLGQARDVLRDRGGRRPPGRRGPWPARPGSGVEVGSPPSTPTTEAPRSASASAAAKPLTPRPATSTRSPDQSASRWVSGRGVLAWSVTCRPPPTRRRTGPRPRATKRPAMIQNRMTMVTSCHPRSSKWCWRGAIRKTRLPVALKEATWMMTDRVIVTKRPPRMMMSSSVRVVIASPASAPPSAREPVSPMKIFAGEAFHQRKPKHAPMPHGGDDGEVVRVAHLVALQARVGLAVLVELPDPDEDVRGEHHHRGARRQAVEAVGEVHTVGRARRS